MSTRDYIIAIAKETEAALTTALPIYLYRGILKSEANDDFASNLATASALLILKKSPKREFESFCEQNSPRVQGVVRWLDADHSLCEILSGAAYNIGYGAYAASGGGLLINRFLRFIRVDAQTNWNSGPSIRQHTDVKMLLPYESRVLIDNLREFRLWVPRDTNPNEQAYYRAVQSFYAEQNTWAKQHSAMRESTV